MSKVKESKIKVLNHLKTLIPNNESANQIIEIFLKNLDELSFMQIKKNPVVGEFTLTEPLMRKLIPFDGKSDVEFGDPVKQGFKYFKLGIAFK